jgi:hypothetical protein
MLRSGSTRNDHLWAAVEFLQTSLWGNARTPSGSTSAHADLGRAVKTTARSRGTSKVVPSVLSELADAGRVVLGLDVRDYNEDGSFREVAWSVYEGADPTGAGKSR